MSDQGRAHSALGPSAAERWINCPASVALVATLDHGDDGSEWAEEGTRAHTLCEIEAGLRFGLITQGQHDARIAAWLAAAEAHGDDVEEMMDCAEQYVTLLLDIAARRGPGSLRLEQRVHSGVPGCWGTADGLYVASRTLDVVDYKHGKGVRVTARENPQLKLYGLGGLELYEPLTEIDEVTLWVCQPRSGGTTSHTLTARELIDWREQVARPAARETQDPQARFGPSEEACRWCPAKGSCKPRARHVTLRDFGSPDLLDEAELADAVRSLEEIRDWCKAVEAEALNQAYTEGKDLPGLKVVLSGGKRSITDDQKAIEVLVEHGYAREEVARESVQTLGTLEKVVGKAKLPGVLGPLLNPGRGRPSLVPEDDPREATSKLVEAQSDFLPAGQDDVE